MDESYHKVIFKFKSDKFRARTTISGRKSESLIDVLKKSDYFTGKSKKLFNLLIHATKVTCALVNPCIPLGALPEGEEFEISDTKVEPSCPWIYTGFDGILIRVGNKGKTLGGAVRVILKHSDYCPGEMILGVFGYNNQTIKEAIVNDGRFKFSPGCEFSLKGGKEEEHIESHNEMSILRNKCTDTIYTIVFQTSESNLAATGRSGTMENTNVSTLIPRYKAHKSMCNEPLYNEFVENFKKSYWTKQSCEILKENFSNDITSKETTLASTHRLVTQHLDSVGLVTFLGSHDIIGSCFLLTGNLVVTCNHVLQDVLELAQSIQNIIIIFNFESYEDNQIHYSVTEQVTSHSVLDFAILRLNPCNTLPRGLLKYLDLKPIRGAVTIIGHPENHFKQVDLGSVIPLDQRESVMKERSPIHMATRETFQIINDSDIVTYKSCFYYGASGSPVFNASGKLVAMHVGGYVVSVSQKSHHVIEYGKPMVQFLIQWASKLNDPNLLRFAENIAEPNGLRLFIERLLQLCESDSMETE